MTKSRLFYVAGILAGALSLHAAVQTPEEYFGFRIGTDKKLVRYDKGIEYLQKLANETDRVRFRNLGQTTEGNPFILLEISSAANLKNLDHWKSLERKLYFQGGAPTDAERDEIFRTGKTVVLNTNSMHSTEIGASQMILELAHRLATENSPLVNKILDNVIFLVVPNQNPDGNIMVTDWYNKVVDTPNEASPLPKLYHHYVGHDNNRDYYLFSQKETRMAAQILWHDWFPSIWLDEHQQGNNGARLFTMPATDPINPNVDPTIYRLNTVFGQVQGAALEAEGKPGVIFNATYTNFWQGAAAWVGWWHNQVGMLTEAASVRLATPTEQLKADPLHPPANAASQSGGRPQLSPAEQEAERRRGFEEADKPIPAPLDINPRTDYPRPWLGGKWTLRDIVDYDMTATVSLLEAAADRRENLLREIYAVNRNTIESGRKGEIVPGGEKSFGVIIPVAGQHDPNEAIDLMNRMMIAGVDVYRAKADFKQDGKAYAAGTFVIPFTQVFARYAKDMLEKQVYPEVRRAPGAPAEAPYDVSAWSLGMQFGVKTDFAKTELDKELALEKLASAPKFTLPVAVAAGTWTFPYEGAYSAMIVNRLLKGGAKVSLTRPDARGVPLAVATAGTDVWNKAVEGFEVRQDAAVAARAKTAVVATALRAPRVGMYQSFDPSMDEGWTRFVFDSYAFEYTTLHNADVKAGKLRQRFDAIVLPDQRVASIMNGLDYKTIVPEYKGGIGEPGLEALKQFVADGGTLVTLGEACNFALEKFPLGVRNLKAGYNRDQHFAPGTIVNMQVDTASPIGRGMPADTYGYYINSPFFQLTEGFSSQKVSVAARYPNAAVRASGWLRGEDLMFGRAAVVTVEMNPGKVVLFGIRPQNRAQTHATLPLLFNALYWSAEESLRAQ